MEMGKSEQEPGKLPSLDAENSSPKSKRNLIQNIQRLADGGPGVHRLWQLLGYHDAITPRFSGVALAAEVFWPL